MNRSSKRKEAIIQQIKNELRKRIPRIGITLSSNDDYIKYLSGSVLPSEAYNIYLEYVKPKPRKLSNGNANENVNRSGFTEVNNNNNNNNSRLNKTLLATPRTTTPTTPPRSTPRSAPPTVLATPTNNNRSMRIPISTKRLFNNYANASSSKSSSRSSNPRKKREVKNK